MGQSEVLTSATHKISGVMGASDWGEFRCRSGGSGSLADAGEEHARSQEEQAG